MTLDALLTLLNSDLSNEYKHWHFYMHAAVMVNGLHREAIRSFLLREAQGEMLHIQQFGDMILACGGKPTATVSGFASNLTDPADILRYAHSMELEVVENYMERMHQASQVKSVEGERIRMFMEDQMKDSAADADHIRQMLMGM